MGAVRATRAARAARRLARARRESDMDAMEQWNVDQRKESFSTPLPGVPNVGFQVPAKPLRFEHWGAHEDLSPPSSRSHRNLKAQLAQPKEQGTQEFILVWATDVV